MDSGSGIDKRMAVDKDAAAASQISYMEALRAVLAQASLLQQTDTSAEIVSLADAVGRILAAPILADRDQPPFHRSTRDGYALRAEDLASAEAGHQLRLIGQLRAGEVWPTYRGALGAGEAVEIMTGAPIPPGADAVLMLEHAELDAFSSRLRPALGRKILTGANIVPRGAEAKQGEVLATPGTQIYAPHIALAASCGAANLSVYRQPRVAILTTGDELVDPDGSASSIATHQIYNSNAYSTAALVQAAGAISVQLPTARDQRESLASGIRAALDASTDADLLLLSGGVSMGKFDLVEEVLASFGAEFFFTGVRVQPGKPLVFGKIPAAAGIAARYFFGLPGNPISTMVTFALFVRPLLAALEGERNWQPYFVMARLSQQVHNVGGLTRFLPAWLDRGFDHADHNAALPEPTVTPIPWQGSGDVAANARANAYIVAPEDETCLAAGSYVRILLLDL